MQITDTRPILEKEPYDVIVAGGGIGGIAAAVAAARQGAKTLLLEKSIVLGGLATIGLISYYEPLCNGTGTQMIFGIAEELIRLSVKDGFDSLYPGWKNKSGDTGVARYETSYSPTVFALVLDEYLRENGVTIRLDSHAVFPFMKGNVCQGVLVESKSGREFYPAKAVIDATGDAELMDKAGVPTVIGLNYMVYMAHYTSRDLATKFAEDGNMRKFRKWLYVTDERDSANEHIHTGVTSEDITAFVLEGRRLALARLREEPKDSRDITMLPFMPQYRTIRRIEGAALFRGVDGETHTDNICDCGDWRKNGRYFQVPYGTLYNPHFPNLWAAGRIISAEEGDGWEITRVIPVCAMTGQAAGTAAAMCIREKCSAAALSVTKLQETLSDSGAKISQCDKE